MNPVKVGICGLGTVGSGTFNVLTRNAEQIARRIGRPIEIVHVGTRRDNPLSDTSSTRVSRDIFDVVRNAEVDIVVELIGGCTVAKELVLEAIANGKHVVTANKALIAEHGEEIFAKAEEMNVVVAYEAAVAGGVPIIKSIREGLAANNIEWLAGIINGTGNFILTEMRNKGRAFEDVLAEAQALGYAEADPTFDVEGIDAAHKLTILASIAFGITLQFDHAYTEGISKITAEDVNYAEELGFRIKHLGISKRTPKGIELRVHPTLIPEKCLISKVDGVMNAVVTHADAVGTTLYYGAGAGAEPTASAVVADIVDIARSKDTAHKHFAPHLGFTTATLDAKCVLPIEEIRSAYYLRMEVADEVGVMASIASILSENAINIKALMQKDINNTHYTVPVVILTQEVQEKLMNKAIAAIEQLSALKGVVNRIRVDYLDS